MTLTANDTDMKHDKNKSEVLQKSDARYKYNANYEAVKQ